MTKEAIRYWVSEFTNNKIVWRGGHLKDNGDFEYESKLCGTIKKRKGNHFATKNEAILDGIRYIDYDISSLTQRKQNLLDQMDKEE